MLNEQNTSKKITKIDLNFITKILPLATVIILSASLIYTSFILYKNFYLTIIYAQKIEILRSQVSIIKIDSELYEKISSDLKKRKNDNFIELSELKNPFQLSEETPCEPKLIP